MEAKYEKNYYKLRRKPYNACLNCAFIGKRCDGPNFLAMDITRLAEWCNLRKKYLYGHDTKWTNAYIADKSNVSKAAIDRFFAGNAGDIKASTLSLILRVLVNGTWGEYPCAMEAINISDGEIKSRLEKAENECERLRNIIDMEEEKLKFMASQIEIKDKQMAEKYIQMKERANFLRRKDWAIGILLLLFSIALGLIITGLVIDIKNPEIGFFWLK